MQYLKLNSNTYSVDSSSPIYDSIYRIALDIADTYGISEVTAVKFAITSNDIVFTYKTAQEESGGLFDSITSMAGNVMGGGYDMIMKHPAISSAVITYILSKATGDEGALGNAVESFIWGYLFDDPGVGIGAGMTDGILGTILGAAGGGAVSGLAQTLLGRGSGFGATPVQAAYRSKPKFAANDIYSQAAGLIQQLQSSGVADPQQMVGALEQNLGSGGLSGIISDIMSQVGSSIGDFFSTIFGSSDTTEQAKNAVNSNEGLQQNYATTKKEEEDKKKQQDNKTTSTGIVSEVPPVAEVKPVADVAEVTTPTMENPLGAVATYTNPFRTIFAKRV